MKDLDDTQLKDLETIVKEYFINDVDYSSLNLGFDDKDLICGIAGDIIKVAAYHAIKSKYSITNKADCGLFAINGIDENFDIKAECTNGYHTECISSTNNQKVDNNLIYIIIPYSASNVGVNIDTNNIKVQRS